MRLKELKMGGFKSFVDATTFPFASNLTAIVGPNGCGKSNIIDAVKWVLGESSAKNLRSDSVSEVIFNGSGSRQPVGQAHVELVFDNSLGRIGGEYSNYSEISIKRMVTRDGASSYYLNGSKCRRKDITGIFLGTGLGSRSYSIIEQGTISRFVEAKPEDLRAFLEEAAGISKYKDRRKETNNRVSHTKDNLNRINELKEVLKKQLEKTKRQARAAERYKNYKEEERELKKQLYALRWKAIQEKLKELNINHRDKQLELEKNKTSKSEIEKNLVILKEQLQKVYDLKQDQQEKQFELNTKIIRYEQDIKHENEKKEQFGKELGDIADEIESYETQVLEARESIKTKNQELITLKSENSDKNSISSDIKDKYLKLEDEKLTIDTEYSEALNELSKKKQTVSVEDIKIQQLSYRKELIEGQLKKLAKELEDFNRDEYVKEIEELEHKLALVSSKVDEQKEILADKKENYLSIKEQNSKNKAKEEDLKNRLHSKHVNLAKFEALQADSADNKKSEEWLKKHDLKDNKKLIEDLEIESGWEKACEIVLGDFLKAICVNEMDSIVDKCEDLSGKITILNTGHNENIDKSSLELTPLVDKIKNPNGFVKMAMQSVFIANDLSHAKSLLNRLSKTESVVTKAGFWLNKYWLKFSDFSNDEDSIVIRQQAINDLNGEIASLDKELDQLQLDIQNEQEKINVLQSEIDDISSSLSNDEQDAFKLKTQVESSKERLSINSNRAKEQRLESDQLQKSIENVSYEIEQAELGLNKAREVLAKVEEEENKLKERKNKLSGKLLELRDLVEEESEKERTTVLQEQKLLIEIKTLENDLERNNELIIKLNNRKVAIENTLDQISIENSMQNELAGLISEKGVIEQETSKIQERLNDVEQETEQNEQGRKEIDEVINGISEQSHNILTEIEGYKVRCSSVEEHIVELEFDVKDIPNIDLEEAIEHECEENLQVLAKRIQKLGPINLVAIDEYKVEQEKYDYYEQQSQDLFEALTTLKNAMQKIDQETKKRFKDTYEEVNKHFTELFPRLFGGGKAELSLTSNELLETGVTIIAKPPGKKISNIQVLSGGEKALTAVALILAIFKLNPSPVCMLDEVDAPLDDANVLRYCSIIKDMSKDIQFLFITHNKITMETAEQLHGVTMNEPGVSKIVSVDLATSVAES